MFQHLLCDMPSALNILLEVVQEKSRKLLDIFQTSMPIVFVHEGFFEPAKLLWQMLAALALIWKRANSCYQMLSQEFKEPYV